MPPDPLLRPDDLADALSSMPDWDVVDGRLHRQLRFADFAEAFAFMTVVAGEAERLDHHPDWCNSWNLVTIDIVSHAAGGITARCVALARAVDRSAPG